MASRIPPDKAAHASYWMHSQTNSNVRGLHLHKGCTGCSSPPNPRLCWLNVWVSVPNISPESSGARKKQIPISHSHAAQWLQPFGLLASALPRLYPAGPCSHGAAFHPTAPSLVRDQYDCVLLLEGLFDLNHRDLLPFTPTKNSKPSLTRDCANPCSGVVITYP